MDLKLISDLFDLKDQLAFKEAQFQELMDMRDYHHADIVGEQITQLEREIEQEEAHIRQEAEKHGMEIDLEGRALLPQDIEAMENGYTFEDGFPSPSPKPIDAPFVGKHYLTTERQMVIEYCEYDFEVGFYHDEVPFILSVPPIPQLGIEEDDLPF